MNENLLRTAALAGSTVNERLFALGQLDAFEAAMAAGDARRVRAILGRAKVDPISIERITRPIDPSRSPLRLGGAASAR